jgi:hypothetical protein
LCLRVRVGEVSIGRGIDAVGHGEDICTNCTVTSKGALATFLSTELAEGDVAFEVHSHIRTSILSSFIGPPER